MLARLVIKFQPEKKSASFFLSLNQVAIPCNPRKGIIIEANLSNNVDFVLYIKHTQIYISISHSYWLYIY